MHIEIINTGSELLLGTTLNTHGAWLGSELLKCGHRVQRQTTVPDGPAITDTLREAMSRSDLVIVTGGIGPTSDDICREAAAEVLGLPLIEDPQALESIAAYFEKLDRPMADDNKKQALKPEGAELLPNSHGTAPGVYCPETLNNDFACALILLPGPPGEMHPMFQNQVIPRLPIPSNAPSIRTLRFTGIGESDFHAKLDSVFSKIDQLEVGYCARLGEVDLRVIGSAASINEASALALLVFSPHCFSDEEESLEAVVVRLLTHSFKKLTLAESCTGGRIANRITDTPGASAVFTHGYITYANEAKHEMLGVSEKLLAKHGAVSQPVALAMAEGALKNSGADIALSVTGIAGPSGGSDAKPVGTVWLGLATPDGSTSTHAFYPRGRETFKQLVSQKALDLIRKKLLEDL